jgi:hypothetical protein
MGDELAEKVCPLSEKDDISKPIVPPVFFSAEVVVAGKGGWELPLAEKLAVKMNLLFQAERLFIGIGTVDKDFIAINIFKKEKAGKEKKKTSCFPLTLRIHNMFL